MSRYCPTPLVFDNYAPSVTVQTQKPAEIIECHPEYVAPTPTKGQKKREYKKQVWELTEQVAHLIPGIDQRGWASYHIDHIVPIQYGFANGIPPERIASLENLRMLHYKDNMDKCAYLTDEGEALLRKWESDVE